MASPTSVIDEIKNIYVFSAGLNSQKLTKYMYDLFKDTSDKMIPTDEVLKYTEAGVTQALFRLDTDSMAIRDSYMLQFNEEIHSLQFVGRKGAGVEYSMNGYILCIMMIGESRKPNASVSMNYDRELWIFDAADLSKGPVCKLSHPDMSYAFTLHSTWIEEAVEQVPNYFIDIKEDFNNPQSFFPGVQANVKEFFEKYVYPNFERKPPVV
jgi:hypothetical protein